MIRSLINPLPVLLAPVLLVGACSDESGTPEDEGGSASSEVLQGSISDEMIPYDRLRSQPPLAELLPGEDAGAAGARGAAGAPPSPGGADGTSSSPNASASEDEPQPQTD